MEATITKPETLTEVLDAIRDNPTIAPFARVVGRWVWVEYPARPSRDIRETLKSLGFVWNRKRECWQHNCGIRCASSPTDPRGKYGEIPVRSLESGEVEPAPIG